MVETEQLIPSSDKESIELVKNTKCYTWSIKVKSLALSDEDLKRLEELDNKLRVKYGGLSP